MHPITGDLGYESSLILTPVLSILSGIGTIHLTFKWKETEKGIKAILKKIFLFVVILTGCSLAIIFSGSLLRGPCDPLDGLLFFLLCPLGASVTSSIYAFSIGVTIRKKAFAYCLFVIFILSLVSLDLLNLYFTPKLDVYDPVLGYFAGPLWDEAVRADLKLALYRIIALTKAFLVFLITFTGFNKVEKTFSLKKIITSSRGWFIITISFILLLATIKIQKEVGISGSRETIRKKLPQAIKIQNVIAYFPPDLSSSKILKTKREIAFRLLQLEEFFGERILEETKIYFFESAMQMKKYTGTGPTSVTKPWLREIYTIYSPYPHPVLKHELAHIFAGKWSGNFLKIPGKFYGLLPDPILLEGTAVAADWEAWQGTPHELTASAMKVKLLEGWNPFGGLSFFGFNKGLGYTASGSFVRFVREKWGTKALSKWYNGSSFKEATGVSEKEAMLSWIKFLSTIEIPPSFETESKKIFSTPAIFKRRCPHAIASLEEELTYEIQEYDFDRAISTYEKMIKIDPENPSHYLEKLRFLSSSCRKNTEPIKNLLKNAIIKKSSPVDFYSTSGDAEWAEGNLNLAIMNYEKALTETLDDNLRRLLSIKIWAIKTGGEAEKILKKYLLCRRWEKQNECPIKATLLLEGKNKFPQEPLFDYLLGRILLIQGCDEVGKFYLKKALSNTQNTNSPVPRNEILLLLGEQEAVAGNNKNELSEIVKELKKEKNLSPRESFRLSELEEWLRFWGKIEYLIHGSS